MSDELLTQREVAQRLKVSVRYLRGSTCPKVLLPGNGFAGRPLVRYEWERVQEWWQSRRVALRKAS